MKKLFPMLSLSAMMLMACTNEDPPVTRSVSSPSAEPADTTGMKITVEIPDSTKVIHCTY